MKRVSPTAAAVGALAFVLSLVASGLPPNVAAVAPDKSDVVLEFDFSASILLDKTTRNRFGAALEQIATRVDETNADLAAGDTTMSLIQFATNAADVPGCVDLRLLQSPSTVSHFADCLRAVAHAYRVGGSKALQQKIGVDTNYVAALEKAATHLPPDAERPAVILFTDGKHDVKGVPASLVVPTRDRLFGDRTSFALLPVGMGLDPTERGALAAGLEALKVVKGMPACLSGATFDWPTVVFPSAGEAGAAVATALQDVTCTYTVAPTPSPTPAPAGPTPPPIADLRLTPGDGKIDLVWAPAPHSSAVPVVDYQARCRAGDNGDWIASTEGISLTPSTTIGGLTNGTEYQCEVASVGKSTIGAWTPAVSSATPIGPPAAPAKPTIEAGNGAVTVSVVSAGPGVSTYTFECSPDGGATWTATADATAKDPTVEIGGLTNGIQYTCRAYAVNAVGRSDPSPVSAAALPCSSMLQCNPTLVPILGGGAGVLGIAILVLLFLLYRDRTTGHVVAVIDVVHTANIGHGANLGIAFVRSPETRRVTGIVADRGRNADIHIRRLRHDRFEVRDKTGKHVVADGDPIVVSDSIGGRHSLTLRAFSTNAASQVATRR